MTEENAGGGGNGTPSDNLAQNRTEKVEIKDQKSKSHWDIIIIKKRKGTN